MGKYNGNVPKGFHIHHIDGNFSNNDISNLECKERSTHLSDHQIHKSERLKEIAIKTLLENSYKASEWHKSEEGRKWHREHAQKALFGEERTIICEGCGKEFTTRCKIKVKYCSRRCKNRINARILYQRKKKLFVRKSNERIIDKVYDITVEDLHEFLRMVYWFIIAQMSQTMSSAPSYQKAGSNINEEDNPEPY